MKNKLFLFYILTFVFFTILYVLTALVNIEPTQIKTENSIFKKSKYFITQRWVFFTLDVTKDDLLLYDIHLNKINVNLSSRKNAYGFKRKSSIIRSYLYKINSETSIYRWQDLNYTLETKPKITSTDTIAVKHIPNILEKGIYILEKKAITPYEWKNDNSITIQSKYILIKVD
jgi:hypothetical protein